MADEKRKYQDNMLKNIELIIKGRPGIYTPPGIYTYYLHQEKIAIDNIMKEYYAKFPEENKTKE